VADVCSQRIVEQLAKYGVVRNKSGKEIFPEELALDPDAWRGAIDGDGNVRIKKPIENKGSITKPYPGIGLTGSEQVCNKFADYLSAIVPSVTGNSEPYRPPVSMNHSIYQVGISGSRAMAAINAIYYEGCASFLDRKMAIAKQVRALSETWVDGRLKANRRC
jgi:hypothetical protein